jgi:protein-disulfide isomerase
MLDANLVLRQMEGAGAKLNLVILDACRNNPFGGRGLRTTASGLATMQAPEGTLISFATQPGNVALDGTGKNSPYTKALAENIQRPGLGLFDAFNAVGLAVKQATGGAQQPWVSSSPIAGSFYFAGIGNVVEPSRPPAPVQVDPCGDASAHFKAADALGTRAAFESHVARFPRCAFADLARAKVAALTPAPSAEQVEAEKMRRAIASNAAALVNSTRQVTFGNANGDVTLVGFFDYNCKYCKRAVHDLVTLINEDRQLKVVLKEFPILSPDSLSAARVSVAALMQAATGKEYFAFHQKLLQQGRANENTALAVAKEVGFDVARLKKDMKRDEVTRTLDENFKLAEALGIVGTPYYVIGKEVVVGALGLDTLRQKVNIARCGQATCRAAVRN